MYKINTFDRAFNSPIKKERDKKTFGGAFNMGTSPTIEETQAKALSFPEIEESLRSQHVEEGNKYDSLLRDGPQFEKVSKKRRLAAVLAGAIAGAANPELGIHVGEMIGGAPKRSAEEAYERKLKNQATLAGNENKRLETALGMESTKEETRRYNTEQERLKGKDKIESEKHTDDLLTNAANRENASDEMRLRGIQFEPTNDGRLMAIDKRKGTMTDLGKFGRSPEEIAKAEQAMLTFKGGIDKANSLAVLDRQGELDKASDERDFTKATTVANTSAKAKVDVARAKVTANPKIDEITKAKFNDAFNAIIAAGADPADILEPDDVLGYKIATDGWGESSEQIKGLRETVRKILSEQNKGGTKPGDVAAPTIDSSNPPEGAPTGDGYGWLDANKTRWGRRR